LFTNDARKIVTGTKAALKGNTAAIPTPCLISAKNTIKGVRDHSAKLTLFGLTLPLIVSIK